LILYVKANEHYKEKWEFPKGNQEESESEKQTALREIEEETSLKEKDLEFEDDFHEKISFFYKNEQGELVKKQVTFLLARTTKSDITISQEHDTYRWANFDEGFETLKEYFDQYLTLVPLMKYYADHPIVPIQELLDRDEKIDKKSNSSRFTELRNKHAHGDVLKYNFPKEFYQLLPRLEELEEEYGIKVDINRILWSLPSYIQIIKSLRFMIRWLNNLIERQKASR